VTDSEADHKPSNKLLLTVPQTTSAQALTECAADLKIRVSAVQHVSDKAAVLQFIRVSPVQAVYLCVRRSALLPGEGHMGNVEL
jgi:hypothetical protein